MPIQEDAFEYILDCGTEGILVVHECNEYLLLSSSELLSIKTASALRTDLGILVKKIQSKDIEEVSKTSYDVIDLDDFLSEDITSKEMSEVLSGLLENILKGAL